MKNVKRIIYAVLAAAMLMIFSVGVFAAESVTIDSVTLDKYVDAYGMKDTNLLTVSVAFTVSDGVDQISILLTASDISEISNDTKAQIIYMNQIDVTEGGVYEFAVEKSKIAEATGLEDINGCTLYLKLGGTDVPSMAATTVEYVDPESVVTYGDVTGEGDIDIGDAVQILRYEAGLVTFDTVQALAADVTGDGDIDIGDAVRILRYEAGLIDSLQ